MRHANAGRKFDRNSSSRRAMFKNLVANLFSHGQIETTVPKAKEVRRLAERIITRVKRLGANMNKEGLEGKEGAQRLALKRDLSKILPKYGEQLVDGNSRTIEIVEHLFREIAPRYLQRPGGYTRIVKTRNRRGDNADLAILTLLDLPTKSVSATNESAVREAQPKT